MWLLVFQKYHKMTPYYECPSFIVSCINAIFHIKVHLLKVGGLLVKEEIEEEELSTSNSTWWDWLGLGGVENVPEKYRISDTESGV